MKRPRLMKYPHRVFIYSALCSLSLGLPACMLMTSMDTLDLGVVALRPLAE